MRGTLLACLLGWAWGGLAPREGAVDVPSTVAMHNLDHELTRLRSEYKVVARMQAMTPPAPPSPPPMETKPDFWGLGVLYSLLSTLVGTLGKDFFRLAALSKHPMKLFTVGVLLAAVLDPMLNVIALSMATQAIVSACAGFVIVWNLLLAPFVLDEHLTRIHLASGALILVGTFGVGLTGPHSEVVRPEFEYMALFSTRHAIIYFALLLVFCIVAAWRWRRAPVGDGRAWGAVLAGAIAGNNFFLKAALSIIACEFDYTSRGCVHGAVRTWQLYAIGVLAIFTAAGGLLVLAVTLRHSEALDAVTIFTGTQIVAAALSSNIVLNENTVSWGWLVVMYTISVLVIVVGLATLAFRQYKLGCFESATFEDSEVEWYARFVERTRARFGFTGRGAEGDVEHVPPPPAPVQGAVEGTSLRKGKGQ